MTSKPITVCGEFGCSNPAQKYYLRKGPFSNKQHIWRYCSKCYVGVYKYVEIMEFTEISKEELDIAEIII